MPFYHVRITRKSQISHDLLELDLTGPGRMKNIVNLYLQGKEFYCENRLVDPLDVEIIRINKTDRTSKDLIPMIHAQRDEDTRRSRTRCDFR
jgi:hypothetical protein